MLTAEELTSIAVQALDRKKGEDIKVLYTRDQTTLADYFVLCTGTSSTQVRALADAVEEAMSQRGEEPHHVDYSAVVVHVFTEEAREFYALERLWSDAVPVDPTRYLNQEG